MESLLTCHLTTLLADYLITQKYTSLYDVGYNPPLTHIMHVAL